MNEAERTATPNAPGFNSGRIGSLCESTYALDKGISWIESAIERNKDLNS